ncbi:unnamed protein product [Alopecurus aequalis]
MEALPVVCYSSGTMNSVLDKLTKLKNHSNPADEFSVLAENLKIDLWSLKEDFCDKLTARGEMHKQVKVCMKQVREPVFNIEDWIDQEPETNLLLDPSGRQKFEYFEAKIHAARERLAWYFNLLKIVPTETDATPIKITINPQLLVEEKSCHGILGGPRGELVKHLTDDKEQMRKVVTLVGMEGIGKTSLAKEIYSELQLRQLFQCHAFLSVGRRPAMKEILDALVRQVNPPNLKLPTSLVDVQEIITRIQEYLGTKRYFIVVDGIWSKWAWKIINCVLPNNLGSRVLTTTCIMDVGRSCSSYPNDIVYQMEALTKENSKILFLSKTIALHEEEPWTGFEEDSCYMLEMCGGMPLAIIVAAGLILTRNPETPAELKMLRESIYSSSKKYSTSDGMTKILHMSYAALSPPLKSCLLYLGIFLENSTTKKDHLIWLWGAEGFIAKGDKECLWVTGERYFNELIARRLIQPVFTCDDDQAVGCTVHTVILDFIRYMSREENFATRAEELSCGPFPCETIRRFSLDCNKNEAGTFSTSSMHLSSLRSLTVFGDVEGNLDPLDFPAGDGSISDPRRILNHGVCINILSAFKLLRVLNLEDTKNLKDYHLEGIGGLVLLRYLGLGGIGIKMLPKTMGELEQLETLDLRRNGLITIHPSIIKLQKLRHLLLDDVDASKILEMPELEAVSDICVNSSSLGMVVELLGISERLRRLELTLRTSTTTETNLVPFLDKVVKSNLQWLSLNCPYWSDEAVTVLLASWERVTALLANMYEPRKLELRIRNLKRVPPTMGSLASLTHLHIMLDEAKAEDFLILGGLANLVLLNLNACNASCSVGGRIIIKRGLFPCLKLFSFRIHESWMGLEFEEGAMPQLQRLGRGSRVSKQMNQSHAAYPDIGVEHLTCLTRVHATFDCQLARVSEVEALEAAVRRQVSEIATKPALELSREYENRMMSEDEELNEEEEEEEEDPAPEANNRSGNTGATPPALGVRSLSLGRRWPGLVGR